MGGKWNRWSNPISEVVDGVKVQRKEYSQWLGMVNRVKGKKYYDGVIVSDNFKSYDWYLDWAKQQKGFLNLETCGRLWAIDKDIVGDGTIYSEDVCVFVPAEINNMFRRSFKHDLPEGVFKEKRKKKFKSAISKFGKHIHLGYFDSVEEAHQVYLVERLVYVNQLIEKYQHRLDDRVATAMIESCSI